MEEARCPSCDAVIASRKALLCGVCEAPLPEELRFPEARRQAIEKVMKGELDRLGRAIEADAEERITSSVAYSIIVS